ncbi:MAG: hypothetical protein RLZZ324_1008 [Candidatus Parcubacteria bacterium]|jgi:membrane-associated phospholipid phosphatase
MASSLSRIIAGARGAFDAPSRAFYVAALALTVILVRTGFDWQWYLWTRGVPAWLIAPGIILGGLVPMFAPLVLWGVGAAQDDRRVTQAGWLMAAAAFAGWLGSSVLKAFTGRAHPDFGTLLTHDTSRDFLFGFLRGGIFWGWPSSHTMVAFAVSGAVAARYGNTPAIKWLAWAWALYVGLAVSVSIHWFSDFLAGALMGAAIGVAMGRAFVAQPAANAVAHEH